MTRNDRADRRRCTGRRFVLLDVARARAERPRRWQMTAADNVGAYGPGSWIADMILGLGPTLARHALVFDSGVAAISLEQLGLLSGDTLLQVENIGSLGGADA